jgi:hypothetical protein
MLSIVSFLEKEGLQKEFTIALIVAEDQRIVKKMLLRTYL